MADCVVCQYWSERLRETRTHTQGKSASEEEKRLVTALRTHQFGACASRFPNLLKDLIDPELGLADESPELCDPLRVRILAASQRDEFGMLSTLELQY